MTRAYAAARIHASSQFRGVTRDRNRWAARLYTPDGSIWLGRFDTEREAMAAYERARRDRYES